MDYSDTRQVKNKKQDIRTTVKLHLRQLKQRQANKERVEENIPLLGKADASAPRNSSSTSLACYPPKTPRFSSCVSVGMFLLWMEPGHPPPSGPAALSLPCRAEVDINLFTISDRKQISLFPKYSHYVSNPLFLVPFNWEVTLYSYHMVRILTSVCPREFYVMNPINFSVLHKCKLRFDAALPSSHSLKTHSKNELAAGNNI